MSSIDVVIITLQQIIDERLSFLKEHINLEQTRSEQDLPAADRRYWVCC
jgi:hypothetical protein